MEMMQMTYNMLWSSDKRSYRVPSDEERLLLVRDGTLKISMNDSTWLIEGGSVALLMPDQNYELGNAMSDTCTFYLLSYHSKLADRSPGTLAGGSTVKDWNKIVFQPHDKGGIRRYFDRPTAMCKRLEMHVTTLNKGLKSHDPHTHIAEEIVLIISGETEMQIGDKFYKGGAGVVYFLGSNVPHAIRNDGENPCTYFAFQF